MAGGMWGITRLLLWAVESGANLSGNFSPDSDQAHVRPGGCKSWEVGWVTRQVRSSGPSAGLWGMHGRRLKGISSWGVNLRAMRAERMAGSWWDAWHTGVVGSIFRKDVLRDPASATALLHCPRWAFPWAACLPLATFLDRTPWPPCTPAEPAGLQGLSWQKPAHTQATPNHPN